MPRTSQPLPDARALCQHCLAYPVFYVVAGAAGAAQPDAGAALRAVADGTLAARQLVAACANCIPFLEPALRRLALADGQPDTPCLACGLARAGDAPTGQAPSVTLRVRTHDYAADLCVGHALALLSKALRPEAFARLVADAGGDPNAVYLLDLDFYDARGVAVHPLPLLTADKAPYTLPELLTAAEATALRGARRWRAR